MPKTGTVLITNAAFRVYSSLPAIYSLVPSIGSINQNILAVFFFFKSTLSSEIIGMLGVSFLIENGKTKKIRCTKQQPKGEIVALSSAIKPSDAILNKLKEFNVTSIVKMASSYKFCVIATGEYDIYAASERANEWDYAAGHAVAQNAGAIIKTLDNKPFLYGKDDYRNPSLLIKRAKNLND